MHHRRNTLIVLKGGELEEIAWKCKDALRKTMPIEYLCEPEKGGTRA